MKRVYKISEILTILNDDGWYLDRQKGSHRQFKHPVKSGLTTVDGKPSEDITRDNLKSILKQAQIVIEKEE
jgi:predicted RNA binding protein YcfA (HicA-like mRNA interferase family)